MNQNNIVKLTVVGFAVVRTNDEEGYGVGIAPLTIGSGGGDVKLGAEDFVIGAISTNQDIVAVFGTDKDSASAYLGCESRGDDATDWEAELEAWKSYEANKKVPET